MAETTDTPRSGSNGGKKDAEPVGPQPCSACRATGNVFANRAEEQISVACPWCEGSGQWSPGLDAQASGVYPGA
jgi:DnaJ-class molecular chaperone